MKVRMLNDSNVIDNVVRQLGEVVETDAKTAKELVASNRGVLGVRIRCRVDCAIIGTVVAMMGEIVEVTDEVAVTLHNRGTAEVVDVSKLTPASRMGLHASPPLRMKRDPDAPMYHGLPTCQIKVTAPKGIFWGTQHVPQSDEAVTVPEIVAERLVRLGHAEFVGLHRVAHAIGRVIKDLTAPREAPEVALTMP